MTISLTWIIAHLIHAAGQSNIDLCWAFYCCIESLVIGHCKHNFYIFIYSKPSLFKPFPRNQLATKAQSFPRKSSNTASPIARQAKDFTWNRGCSSNSPPLKHGDQIPHPLEDSDNQIPSSPGRQRCQMPGVCPGGGHVEASIWPIHQRSAVGQTHPSPNDKNNVKNQELLPINVVKALEPVPFNPKARKK